MLSRPYFAFMLTVVTLVLMGNHAQAAWGKHTIDLEQPLIISDQYANNLNRQWNLRIPGADAVTIHFAQFETESNYDFVRVYDKNNGAQSFDGFHQDLGVSVFGDEMTVEFQSDGSVSAGGFVVDQISYVGEDLLTLLGVEIRRVLVVASP